MSSSHSSGDPGRRVVIDLVKGESYLELDQIEVEAREDVEFSVSGRLRGVDGEILENLSGHEIVPSEVHFLVRDNRS